MYKRQVWDIATQERVTEVDKGERRVEALTLAPIGGRPCLVFGTHDGSVHVVDLDDAGTRHVIHIGAQVKGIVVAPGSRIVVATSRGLLCILMGP